MDIGKPRRTREIEHPHVPDSPGDMPNTPAPAEPAHEPSPDPAQEPAAPAVEPAAEPVPSEPVPA